MSQRRQQQQQQQQQRDFFLGGGAWRRDRLDGVMETEKEQKKMRGRTSVGDAAQFRRLHFFEFLTDFLLFL